MRCQYSTHGFCEAMSDAACLCEGGPARPGITRTDEIVLMHVYPPIPIRQFDWQASWDNDEPDDDGRMLTGHGPTPLDAIVDLLDNTEDKL